MLVYGVNMLIEVYGWRTASVVIGVGFWLVTVPCACIVRQRPGELNLLPDGDAAAGGSLSGGSGGSARPPEGFTISEVLKTRAFWTLTAIVTVSGGTMHSVTVHIMPYLLSVEVQRGTSSLIASLLIVVSVLGRFGMGWLRGRIAGRNLLALGLVLQESGCLLLIWSDSFWMAMLFVAAFGPGYGGIITLRLVLQADYFGPRAFGSVQGLIMAVMVLGSMTGPMLTGLAYDSFRSYNLAWQVMALLLFFMIPAALSLKRPEKPAAGSQERGKPSGRPSTPPPALLHPAVPKNLTPSS